jgi:hypothetical protein
LGHSTWILTIHVRYLCVYGVGTVCPTALVLGVRKERMTVLPHHHPPTHNNSLLTHTHTYTQISVL